MSQSVRRATLLLMGSMFLSRVIGFFREWILARMAGASRLTDVYYASFTIPDFLNYLMATGALSISFMPLLGHYRAKGEDTGKLLYRALLTVFSAVLIILVVVGAIFARDLGRLIAPGFDAAQKDELERLLRIILPAQIFFYFGALATSVQHFHGRFWLPALSPIIYNASIIFFGHFFYDRLGISAFSWGVLFGSALGHGVVQLVGSYRCGYSPAPCFRFTAEVRAGFKRYLWLSFPIMLGLSLVVTDEWITKYAASFLEPKSVSWLAYARTEMRIPVAIIGQAAGMASFPWLSRLWAENQRTQYGAALSHELAKLWAIGTVCAVILYECALPATTFLYGGGALSSSDIEAISDALRIYSIGVFFWTAQVLLARGFYAAGRTWLPSVVGTCLTVLCLPLYAYGASRYGYRGLAWAGTLGIALYCVVLWICLRQHLSAACAVATGTAWFGRFAVSWILVVVIVWAISRTVSHWELYQGTQMSALLHLTVVMMVTILPAWVCLRTVFRRITGEPLF